MCVRCRPTYSLEFECDDTVSAGFVRAVNANNKACPLAQVRAIQSYTFRLYQFSILINAAHTRAIGMSDSHAVAVVYIVHIDLLIVWRALECLATVGWWRSFSVHTLFVCTRFINCTELHRRRIRLPFNGARLHGGGGGGHRHR